ncbi:MAG: ribonuclease HII [Candidatus Paceibacterota bacterium]|jgi:ribonuclease HII
MDLITEKYYWKKGYKIIVGLDEAGRGPLAGPVTAAAVIINPKITAQLSSPCKRGSKILSAAEVTIQKFKTLLQQARDSKKLSAQQREKLFKLIKQSSFLKFAYCSVNEKVIDKINIEQATFKAMKNCLKSLNKKYNLKPSLILIDGNRIIDNHLPCLQKTIIKGDDKILSIALASIIAKVIRDKKMTTLAKEYPNYHFEIHKGYPTKLHRKLLKKYGPCEIHRKSYKPVQVIIQKSKF